MSRERSEAVSDREFHFTRADFSRVCRMIYEHAGISLASGKQDLVYSRLARRLRATGYREFAAYLDALQDDPLSDEWERFTNALTTNLTSFFRESHHFDVLRDVLRARSPRQPVTIWCCAASTGEEPYTIAMTAAEAYGRLDPPVSILATDIDTQVLETARRGVYPLERIDPLSKEQRRAFFHKGRGRNEGYCRVVPALQNLIRFEQLNLLSPQWAVKGPLDIIFCRNVMIYFDKPTQLRILKRFSSLLTPEGLLFTGHSESLFNVAEMYRSIDRTVYQRVHAVAAVTG